MARVCVMRPHFADDDPAEFEPFAGPSEAPRPPPPANPFAALFGGAVQPQVFVFNPQAPPRPQVRRRFAVRPGSI